MVYSLAYRRPPHVDSARASVLGDEKTKSIGETSINSQASGGSGGSGGMSFGIPDALSFDRIIAGGTCPVSRLPVFFLVYNSDFFSTLLSQHLEAGSRSTSMLRIYMNF